MTFSFDRHLEGQGWARIHDLTELRAGDLVFTTGAPDHVMWFHDWVDRARAITQVHSPTPGS